MGATIRSIFCYTECNYSLYLVAMGATIRSIFCYTECNYSLYLVAMGATKGLYSVTLNVTTVYILLQWVQL